VSRGKSLRFAEGQRQVVGMDVSGLLGNGRGNKRRCGSMNLRGACYWFRTWRCRLFSKQVSKLNRKGGM
jgi:hypothetical protein